MQKIAELDIYSFIYAHKSILQIRPLALNLLRASLLKFFLFGIYEHKLVAYVSFQSEVGQNNALRYLHDADFQGQNIDIQKQVENPQYHDFSIGFVSKVCVLGEGRQI